MLQPLASSISEHSHENAMFGEYERFLNETGTQAATQDDGSPSASGPRGMYALLLLAFCGAAFALAQADVKETLLTGRSVAHATGR